MVGYEIESCTNDALLRFVRALGQHRYVAGRLHLAHAFAVSCAGAAADVDPVLADATAWANRAISSGAIDLDSKDERLYRRISDAELNALLAAFWGPDSDHARSLLREKLASIDALPDETALLPFDESIEDDVFPVLIDAGWELLPLTQLDHERHRGAIQSFDDFEVARFEEENAVPFYVTLHELPVIGGVELLAAFDDLALLRAPFVLWQDGNETYLDYVLRGVLRAAKIEQATE